MVHQILQLVLVFSTPVGSYLTVDQLNRVQVVRAGGVEKIYWSSFLSIVKRSCVWSRVVMQRLFLINSHAGI